MDQTSAAASTRAADLRFLLAHDDGGPPRPVRLLGNGAAVDRVRRRLWHAGELAAHGARASLVLAPPAAGGHFTEERRLPGAPAAVIIDPALGTARSFRLAARLRGTERLLRRQRYRVTRVLVLRDGDGAPRAAAPLASSAPLTHLMARRAVPRSPRALVARLVASLPVLHGLLTLTGNVVLLGQRKVADPGLLAGLGVPIEDWMLLASAGDEATRVVVLAFDGTGKPVAAVKTARTAATAPVFAAEREALALAESSGIGGFPRLLAHGRWGDVPVSLEQAAMGEELSRLIARDARKGRAALLRAVDWAHELAVRSRVAPGKLEAERVRLAELTRACPGAPESLVSAVDGLPGVLAHNDLGTWNVLVSDGVSWVVDWESARQPALPLWDLLYLLSDGLALLDGARSQNERARHAIALHSGQLASSDLLFANVFRACHVLDIPPERAGAIATLCWLHHASSRGERATRGAGAGTAPLPAAGRLAGPWLTMPDLGPTWPAYEAWRTARRD